ncbi:GNAT family N-acetyltransferase [Cellvibrio mixtus]|uniref:GNAT family N-acetyltransferase n=1 Tax=Cellvibrio mixtus TaxID=39650 RepID=UPI0005877A27|nr:GNAT family N-acetyltransferase [Cellvibrio mixtus]
MADVSIEIVSADYKNPQHAKDLVYLLNAYALDPMGGGAPLTGHVQNTLVDELARRSFAISLLAYVDGKPAGLLNAFEGFSTFAAKPLLNVHDIVVVQEFRGLQLSQQLLAALERIARERGCCKITLEVLSGNETAKRAYLKFGFAGYELKPEAGQALFWQKKLV